MLRKGPKLKITVIIDTGRGIRVVPRPMTSSGPCAAAPRAKTSFPSSYVRVEGIAGVRSIETPVSLLDTSAILEAGTDRVERFLRSESILLRLADKLPEAATRPATKCIPHARGTSASRPISSAETYPA